MFTLSLAALPKDRQSVRRQRKAIEQMALSSGTSGTKGGVAATSVEDGDASVALPWPVNVLPRDAADAYWIDWATRRRLLTGDFGTDECSIDGNPYYVQWFDASKNKTGVHGGVGMNVVRAARRDVNETLSRNAKQDTRDCIMSMVNQTFFAKLAHETAYQLPEGDVVWTNSARWEKAFMQHVVNTLIDQRFTPHLAAFASPLTCSIFRDFNLKSKTDRSVAFKKLATLINQGVTTPSMREHMKLFAPAAYALRESGNMTREQATQVAATYRAVMKAQLEPNMILSYGHVSQHVSNGEPLHVWARRYHSVDAWRSVLFQLVYTIASLAQLGIRHNDLHAHNAIVSTDAVPRSLDGSGEPIVHYLYRVDNNVFFRVPVARQYVTLVDWDLGSLDVAHFQRVTNQQQLPPDARRRSEIQQAVRSMAAALPDTSKQVVTTAAEARARAKESAAASSSTSFSMPTLPKSLSSLASKLPPVGLSAASLKNTKLDHPSARETYGMSNDAHDKYDLHNVFCMLLYNATEGNKFTPPSEVVNFLRRVVRSPRYRAGSLATPDGKVHCRLGAPLNDEERLPVDAIVPTPTQLLHNDFFRPLRVRAPAGRPSPVDVETLPLFALSHVSLDPSVNVSTSIASSSATTRQTMARMRTIEQESTPVSVRATPSGPIVKEWTSYASIVSSAPVGALAPSDPTETAGATAPEQELLAGSSIDSPPLTLPGLSSSSVARSSEDEKVEALIAGLFVDDDRSTFSDEEGFDAFNTPPFTRQEAMALSDVTPSLFEGGVSAPTTGDDLRATPRSIDSLTLPLTPTRPLSSFSDSSLLSFGSQTMIGDDQYAERVSQLLDDESLDDVEKRRLSRALPSRLAVYDANRDDLVYLDEEFD